MKSFSYVFCPQVALLSVQHAEFYPARTPDWLGLVKVTCPGVRVFGRVRVRNGDDNHDDIFEDDIFVNNF